jgi:hypothetical protein
MNRRTQGVLLVGSLAVATIVVLSVALARGLDHHLCETGFPTLISYGDRLHLSSVGCAKSPARRQHPGRRHKAILRTLRSLLRNAEDEDGDDCPDHSTGKKDAD